jgi:hypothetical protein
MSAEKENLHDRVAASGVHAECNNSPIHNPPTRVSSGSRYASMAEYKKDYDRSVSASDGDAFWREKAHEYLTWSRDFTEV